MGGGGRGGARRVEGGEEGKGGGRATGVWVGVVGGRNREGGGLGAAAGVGVKKLKRVRVGGCACPASCPSGST